MEKRLYRSRDDRMIWGVCGGIAKYFGIDPTVVRLITVLLLFAGGAGILGYIILTIVVPLESSSATVPREVVKENVAEIKETATHMGEDIRATFARQDGERKVGTRGGERGMYLAALILIGLGVIFFLSNFNIFSWLRFDKMWPVILILVGVVIIFGARRK